MHGTLFVPAAWGVPDLRELLECVGEAAKRATWTVRNLEVLGPEAQSFMQRIEASPERELVVSGEELLRQADVFGQTVDGEFVAYDEPPDSASDRAARRSSRLKIKAIDGSGFDVSARDETVLRCLRARFPKATWSDAAG
jgi:hypothetical protein